MIDFLPSVMDRSSCEALPECDRERNVREAAEGYAQMPNKHDREFMSVVESRAASKELSENQEMQKELMKGAEGEEQKSLHLR